MSIPIEETMIRSAFEVIGAIAVAVLGYFIKGHDDKLKKIEDDGEKNVTELYNFRLEAEKRFAKEETLQASLSRIHDRIDDMGKDIKTLIGRDANKKS